MGTLERLVGTGLAAGRIAIGAGLWLAPRRSARALGFTELDDTALALARIAATRDLILGAWQLHAIGEGGQLARASTAVALADAGDALTFALALTQGDGDTRRAGMRGLAAAAPASIAGFWLARRSAEQA